MGNILKFTKMKIAFGKTKIINGIQEIGFTHAIVACDTDHFMVETELLLKVVFKPDQFYGN